MVDISLTFSKIDAIMLSATARTVYLSKFDLADYIANEPFTQYCGQSPKWAAP